MSDATTSLDVVFRLIQEGNGGELTIRELRELKTALKNARDEGDLTLRQFKMMEEAAKRMGGEAAAAMRGIGRPEGNGYEAGGYVTPPVAVSGPNIIDGSQSRAITQAQIAEHERVKAELEAAREERIFNELMAAKQSQAVAAQTLAMKDAARIKLADAMLMMSAEEVALAQRGLLAMDRKIALLKSQGDAEGVARLLEQRAATQAMLSQHSQYAQPIGPQQPAPAQPSSMVDEFSSQNYNIKRHWGAVAGSLMGMPGMGMMVATGGTAAAVGVSLLALEKAVHSVSAALTKFREEEEAAVAMGKVLQQTQHFSTETIQRFRNVASALADDNHSTKEWITTLGELARVGADPATVGKLTEDARHLADLMGGDLGKGTKALTEAYEGNYDALKDLGIVVDSTLNREQALAFISGQLAMRTSEFGNAAVSSAPKVYELKKAVESVGTTIGAMKVATEGATDALQRLLKDTEGGKSEKLKQIDADEKKSIQEVETAFAEKRIKTRADADAKIAVIQKAAAGKRVEAEKEAYTTERAAQVAAFQDADEMIRTRAGEVAALKQKLADIDATDFVAGKRAEIQDKIAALAAEASGQGGMVEPGEGRLREIAEETKRLKHELTGESQKSAARGPVQAKLNEMREKYGLLDDEDVKRMEKAQEAILELDRKFAAARKLIETEGGTSDLKTRQKTAEDKEREQKRLEGMARNWSQAAERAAKDGLPAPEMPKDLEGRTWTYDAQTRKVQFDKLRGSDHGAAGGKTDMSPISNQANAAVKVVNDVARDMASITEVFVTLKTATAQALSRMKNDGGRIG